jgi:hypothetical protein
MTSKQQSDRLRLKSASLHSQQARDWNALESQYYSLKESITLGAIVRQGAAACLKRATNKEQLFYTVLSLVGGYLSKKALVGNSKKGSERIMGYAVQFLTTQFLSKITNN